MKYQPDAAYRLPAVQPQPLSVLAEEAARDDFRNDVWAGLASEQKAIPCKYFYDERGSRLFDAICRLPEYYPTRTETALLEQHAPHMAELIGEATLIEFGSGSSMKTRLLLNAAPRITCYIPVDISCTHLVHAATQIAQDYPRLRVAPVCADFMQPFDLPARAEAARYAGFFPGSTIGNFSEMEAFTFLSHCARLLGPKGVMIIGVDLKKDPAILHAAYNDAAGVTAAFNVSLLCRINHELDGTFDTATFRHDAVYNPLEGRIEMYLVSERDQNVKVAGRSFAFKKGERIHTENSRKYDVAEFQALATAAGFMPEQVWKDADGLFSLHYLTVAD